MDRGLLVHDRPGARPPGGGPFQRAKHGSKVHVTLGTMLEVLRQGGRGYGKVKPLLLQRIAQLQLLGEQRRAEHAAPQLQELLAAAAQLGDTDFLSFVRSVAAGPGWRDAGLGETSVTASTASTAFHYFHCLHCLHCLPLTPDENRNAVCSGQTDALL